MELAKPFSHSEGHCFVLLTASFALQKLFSFMRSHLLIVDLSAYAIGVRSVQEVVCCVNVFKAIPYIPFYQVQCV